MKTYDIDGNEVGPLRAAELLADHDGRRVGRTIIVLDDDTSVIVSTVHLVFDHGCGEGLRIFETKVLMDRKPGAIGTPLDGDAVGNLMGCVQYSTLDGARAGHDRMVQRLKRLTHLN